jgi:glycerol-3-phosphate dehydrogenase (NAD(P)+)
MPGRTLEGAAAIQVIGPALPKLAGRGLIGADDFPLMRQLYDVVGRTSRSECSGQPSSEAKGGRP